MTIPIETHLQNFSFLQMDTENHLSPQSSRRLLLAQWKAQRKVLRFGGDAFFLNVWRAAGSDAQAGTRTASARGGPL
jgi:hypothetical protein